MSQKLDNPTKEELSAKEKRIKDAVVMHYGKGMQVQEIAEEMGYNRKTIQRYLDSDFASNLRRVYSDVEIYDLKAQLESEIRDSYKMANNLLAKAIQSDEATPRDLLKASEQAMEIRMKHIQMLKELGINLENQDKPSKESKVMKRMQKAYKKQQEKEENTDNVREELIEGLKAKKQETQEDN